MKPSEWPDDYRECVEAHTQAYVAGEKQKLKDVTSEALRNRGSKEYAERLRVLKRRVKAVSRKSFYVEPSLWNDKPLKKGKMGVLNLSLVVQQVIDEQSALLSPISTQTYADVIGSGPAQQGNFVTRQKEVVGKPFMLRGIDTDEWTDGDRIKPIRGAYRVEGTETYDTAIGGTSTVFVVKPIEPAKADK